MVSAALGVLRAFPRARRPMDSHPLRLEENKGLSEFLLFARSWINAANESPSENVGA